MKRYPNRDGNETDGWLLLAALLACHPLSAALPPALAREHGVLENLQVMVLGAGCMAALLAHLRMRSERPARMALLARWVAPVWLLLAGRELSWGKAWLQQPGLDGALAAPPWLLPLVWPGAAALVAWLAFTAWHWRIDALARAPFVRRAPWLCLGAALAAAMGSTCAEGHMSCSLDMPAARAQVFEELSELIAYVALYLLQDRVLRHRAAPVRPGTAVLPVEARVEEAG